MLMRWAMCSVCLRGLDDLGEDAARGGGVQERDARAAYAGARRLVDQPQAALAQRRQGGLDVGDLVGDVVQARAALGQESPHGRVAAQRAQQLDVVLADVEQHGLDALLVDHLAMCERHAVVALVQRDRRFEVLDGDSYVVDPGEHPRERLPPRGIRPRGLMPGPGLRPANREAPFSFWPPPTPRPG